MSAPQLKVHFDLSPSPPAYSPPPAYAAHSFGEHEMSFAQKEHLASMAEQKLSYLVSSKRREPSLRHVLLHAGFLERILDSIDAHVPDQYEDEPMIEESATVIEQTPSYDLSQSLTTIVEVDDEMEIDEEDEHDEEEEEESEDEDMPPLQRTISHRPGSPSISDEEDILSESDSDDELPSPPPVYNASPDHPLFNLFEVREKARRDELSNHYKIDHNDQHNLFLMANNLAVAA
jgi:hypothetical protein